MITDFLGGIRMNLNIGVIKGDGIGPEIVGEAMKVLDCGGGIATPVGIQSF